jgi:hypothetical protein
MTPTLFYIQLKNTQIIAQFFMISKNFIIIISTLPLEKMFPNGQAIMLSVIIISKSAKSCAMANDLGQSYCRLNRNSRGIQKTSLGNSHNNPLFIPMRLKMRV